MFFRPSATSFATRRSVYTAAEEKAGRADEKTTKEVERSGDGRKEADEEKSSARHARGNKIRFSQESFVFVDIHSTLQAALFAPLPFYLSRSRSASVTAMLRI